MTDIAIRVQNLSKCYQIYDPPRERLKQFVVPKLCFGAAQGLRQPMHAEDVATACIAASQSTPAGNHAYDLSGAERLTYREMVARLFRAMDRPARFRFVVWQSRACEYGQDSATGLRPWRKE